MTSRRSQVGVVVVEAPSTQRSELLSALQHDGDISILGLADSASGALTLVAQARPDVVVLDLALPDGGHHAIEQLMAHTPTPILVLSAAVDDLQSRASVEALISGALEALPRPVQWTTVLAARLRNTVHQISKVSVIRHPRGNRAQATRTTTPRPHPAAQPIVAMAASTGGPSALTTVLAGLSGLPAAVLVVQHLHPDFTAGLLEWMARASALPVEMAVHNQTPRAGRVYLAPGGLHLRIAANGNLELNPQPATVHRPSADQLFDSVAQYGKCGIGVLLTGMGDDGAQGLLAMHDNGARTLAQDEASCAVFGMPRAAQRLGAVTEMLPLDQVAKAIHRAVRAAQL